MKYIFDAIVKIIQRINTYSSTRCFNFSNTSESTWMKDIFDGCCLKNNSLVYTHSSRRIYLLNYQRSCDRNSRKSSRVNSHVPSPLFLLFPPLLSFNAWIIRGALSSPRLIRFASARYLRWDFYNEPWRAQETGRQTGGGGSAKTNFPLKFANYLAERSLSAGLFFYLLYTISFLWGI